MDALCIDQSDLTDRNLMVSRMGEIYHNAREVFVWLGDLTANEGQNQQLGWMFKKITRWRFYIYQWVQIVNNNLRHTRLLLDTLRRYIICYGVILLLAIVGMYKSCWDDRDATAVETIADLPYWSRAWIVQEHLLSQKRRLLFGNRQVSWSYVSSFVSAVGIHPNHNLLAYIRNNEGRLTLAHTLTSFGRRECSEPLDRIYAFAGLPDSPLKLAVDYGCSPLVAVMNTISFCTVEISATSSSEDGTLGTEWLLDQRRLAATLFENFRGPLVTNGPRTIDNKGLKMTELRAPCTYKHVQRPCGQYVRMHTVTAHSPQPYRDSQWLKQHGFRKGDRILDCNLAYRGPYGEGGLRQSSEDSYFAVIARRRENNRASIIGSFRSIHSDCRDCWTLEKYSPRGLPKVNVYLPPKTLNGGRLLT